jgi:nuclear transport factor 2 (NTF2) superfamily protein
VRFAYESHDSSGQWWRSHGNENWEFDDRGLMRIRLASISDQRITEADRMFFWDRTGPGLPRRFRTVGPLKMGVYRK